MRRGRRAGGAPFSRAAGAFFEHARHDAATLLGLVIVVTLIAVALLAPWIAPYGANQNAGAILAAPGWDYPFGTNFQGRDLFSRVILGSRNSLAVAFPSVALAVAVGVPTGLLVGYLGGWVDDILMRLTETFMVIPRFFLALIIVAFFGASIWNIILAISILTWPVTARLVRSEFLTLRTRQFVDAAHVIGTKRSTIIFREILPNAIGVVVVNASLLTAQAMLLEAGLSYLGLGDPSLVTWGRMLYEAQPFLRQAWWMAVYPGLGIFLSVLTLNLLGDGLNDVLNPRSSEIHRTGL